MRQLLIISTVLPFLFSEDARAFEYIISKGIGMGGTAVLSQPSATTLVNIPCGGPPPGYWQVETGYNRRFELGDLDHLFVAGAWRWRRFTAAIGASQFGKADLYAEQLLKGSLAMQYTRVAFGATVSAMQVQIGNGYGPLRAATFGLGASLRTARIQVAIEADNLTRPLPVDNSPVIEPVYTLVSELVGIGSYSITGRITVEDKQKPQFAIGQLIRLSRRGSFFWGLSTGPLEYGGGIEVSIASGTVSYATSVHPVLGFSHTISFSYGSAHGPSKDSGEFD
jgi:hypothetical protein